MKISDPNYHQKLMEMCDCYLDTDYLKQLQKIATGASEDLEEDAIKYMALAILEAITEQAGKLSFKKKGAKASVAIKKEENLSLPPPPLPLLEKIFAIMRIILHLDEDKGAMELSLGLRNGQIDAQVKIERKKDKESLKLKFPRR